MFSIQWIEDFMTHRPTSISRPQAQRTAQAAWASFKREHPRGSFRDGEGDYYVTISRVGDEDNPTHEAGFTKGGKEFFNRL